MAVVDRRYMEERPGKPGLAKTTFDQAIIPQLIDAAGCLEAGLERLAIATRSRPAAILCGTLLLGVALGLTLLPKRRT